MSASVSRGARVLALLLCLLGAGGVAGQAAPDRHEVPGLGALSFPTSTTSAPAQAAFERGMLLLHLFEYPDATRAFQDAERLDPGFAMAYWGEAMTYNHPVWNQQDRDAGRAALAKLAATPDARAAKAATARERDYLATLDVLYGDGDKRDRDHRYAEAMAALAARYPDDDEAQLFHALALLGQSEGERDVPVYLQAAAIAQAAFERNPRHPGAAHYWIHGMDDPEHAAGALAAAQALAGIAPDAGHAQHMTSHIFIALGMWPELNTANVNGERVVIGQLRARGQPEFACGHYTEWLVYGLFQQGRHREAMDRILACQRESRAAVAWMRARPGTPVLSYGTADKLKARLDGSLVSLRASALIESASVRDRALAMDLDLGDVGSDRGWALFSRGMALAERGDVVAARRHLAALQALTTGKGANGEHDSGAAYLAIMARMLEARLAQHDGHLDRAIELARSAAADYEAMPFDFGPPVPVKPPRELLGELRLAAKQPVAAVTEFDLALKSAPNRALSLLGRARALKAAGDPAQAAQTYRELAAIWKDADADLPALAEVREGAGSAAAP